MAKEYRVKGVNKQGTVSFYGDPYYSLRRWAVGDMEHAQKQFPKDTFSLQVREVSEWEDEDV